MRRHASTAWNRLEPQDPPSCSHVEWALACYDNAVSHSNNRARQGARRQQAGSVSDTTGPTEVN
jgi:hypothetical protein